MSDKLAAVFIGVVIVLGIGGAWYDGQHKDEEWKAYAEQNHCHRIGRTTDTIGLSNGNGDIYTPSQVIYSCDTGIKEYTR